MRRFLILLILLIFNSLIFYGIKEVNKVIIDNDLFVYFNEKPIVIEDEEEENLDVVVDDFNGENIEKISQKLDKYFEETALAGYGDYITKTAAYKNVNPYLVAGIVLESTSCKYECTPLFNECNNVFMEKGEPGCFGGSYKKYKKIDDSILELTLKIRKGYTDIKEQVPAKMYKDFNKNLTWAFKVEKYMEKLKGIKVK